MLVGIRHQVQEEPDPGPGTTRTCAAACKPWPRLGSSTTCWSGRISSRPRWTRRGRCPELQFVLDHAGKPDVSAPPSERVVAAMEQPWRVCPNVAVKLSGMTSEAPPAWTPRCCSPFAEALLTSFGPGRLMFGSDWPVCLLGGGYDATIAADRAADRGAVGPGARTAVRRGGRDVYGWADEAGRCLARPVWRSQSSVRRRAARQPLLGDSMIRPRRLALDAAWEGGVRYFDTAPHYGLGLSERRIGAALRGRPRDQFSISTKVGRLLVPNPSPTGSDLARGRIRGARRLPARAWITAATASCGASRPALSGSGSIAGHRLRARPRRPHGGRPPGSRTRSRRASRSGRHRRGRRRHELRRAAAHGSSPRPTSTSAGRRTLDARGPIGRAAA